MLTKYVLQRNGEIHIHLSDVDCYDEKEIIVPFQIDPNIKNLTSLWELVQQKLKLQLKVSSDDNEWFDEYSVYTKKSSPIDEQEDTATDGKSSKSRLTKTANDFIHHFEQCVMSGAIEHGGQVSITLEIKVKLFILFPVFLFFFFFF